MKSNVHQVYMTPDASFFRVSKKDVVFVVYRRKKKYGELRVSRGAIVWRGRNDQLGRKLSWSRFDEFMEEHARREERRRPGSRRTVSRQRLNRGA